MADYQGLLQVKFIKFFAWEDRWIQRALDAREVELQWLIKGMWTLMYSVQGVKLIWFD